MQQICPLHYSSVTHPLEADCTFLMYWKQKRWNFFTKFVKVIYAKHGGHGQRPAYLVKNSSVSLICRWSPLLSSLLHLLICYQNIYSPFLNINVDDVSIFNQTNWTTFLKRNSQHIMLVKKNLFVKKKIVGFFSLKRWKTFPYSTLYVFILL
jgi:hypothetical protein